MGNGEPLNFRCRHNRSLSPKAPEAPEASEASEASEAPKSRQN